MAFHLSPLVSLIYTEDCMMDDYSHCHYWDNKRDCISFECKTCKYKREYDESQYKVELDEELFEI